MQLVLGAQIGASLGTSGAPLSAPPERFRLGERGRRVLRRAAWVAAFTGLVALGALHGARVAIGTSGVSALAGAEPEREASAPAARRGREPSGSFWRPETSSAQRQAPEISARRWQPRDGD